MGAAADEWVSWETAAEISGCPVPTIEWYVRLGHIDRRERRGSQPTLRRESVDRFATAHAKRVAERQEHRKVRDRERKRARARRSNTTTDSTTRSPPEGWIATSTAAEILDRGVATVLRLCRTGCLRHERIRGRVWVEPASVERALAARSAWVSRQVASQIVGCPISVILRAVNTGDIASRDAGRSPSLSRSSVEKFATRWIEQEAERRRRGRAERQTNARRTAQGGPPDDGHVWLDTVATGLVLELSSSRVRQLAARDRIPHTRIGHRIWFRRDHAEKLRATRVFANVVGSASGASTST